jgi:hypothetical protein
MSVKMRNPMSTEELPEVPLQGNDWTIKEAWWAGYYACKIENGLDLFVAPRSPFPDELIDGEESIPNGQ